MSAARFADDRDPKIRPFIELAAEAKLALSVGAAGPDDIPAEMLDLLINYEVGLRQRDIDRLKGHTSGVNDPRLPHTGGQVISHRRYGSTVIPRP